MRLAAVILLVVSGGCAPVCENKVLSEIISPDRLHRAVLFNRSCGATTGNSLQVSVLDRDGTLASGGNLFVADQPAEEAPAIDPAVRLRWQSNGQLLVRYDPRLWIFKQDGEATGIGAMYEPLSLSTYAVDAKAPACPLPPDNWSGPADPPPHQLPTFLFELRRDGRLIYTGCEEADCGDVFETGATIADGHFADGLKLASGRLPRPVISLRAENGASCRRLEGIRRLMSASFQCSEYECNEGGFEPPLPIER